MRGTYLEVVHSESSNNRIILYLMEPFSNEVYIVRVRSAYRLDTLD